MGNVRCSPTGHRCDTPCRPACVRGRPMAPPPCPEPFGRTTGRTTGLTRCARCCLVQVLFLAGVSLIIGPRGVVRFFFQKRKIRGTSCFLGGIALVLIGWPVFGAPPSTPRLAHHRCRGKVPYCTSCTTFPLQNIGFLEGAHPIAAELHAAYRESTRRKPKLCRGKVPYCTSCATCPLSI